MTKWSLRSTKKLEHARRRLQGPRGHSSERLEKWGGCGWAVLHLDYDEEMGLLHGMYGSMEAENEVQRTIKKADLTAF